MPSVGRSSAALRAAARENSSPQVQGQRAGVTPAGAPQIAVPQTRAARAGSAVRKKQQKPKTTSVVKWAVQRAGLPMAARNEMRGVIKHGKTAAEQVLEEHARLQKEKEKAAQQQQTQPPPLQPQPELQAQPAAAPPPAPAHSHHNKAGQLRAPLPIEWEQVDARSRVSGIRCRVP